MLMLMLAALTRVAFYVSSRYYADNVSKLKLIN